MSGEGADRETDAVTLVLARIIQAVRPYNDHQTLVVSEQEARRLLSRLAAEGWTLEPLQAEHREPPPDAREPKPDGWHTYHICDGLLRELTWSEGQALCVFCGQWFDAAALRAAGSGEGGLDQDVLAAAMSGLMFDYSGHPVYLALWQPDLGPDAIVSAEMGYWLRAAAALAARLSTPDEVQSP